MSWRSGPGAARRCAAATTAYALLAFGGSPLAAAEDGSAGQRAEPATEVWLGAEAFRRAWSLYSGADIAIQGAIREDGLRLRVVGGYGQYDHACRNFDPVTLEPFLAPCRGDVSFFDVLAGYRWQYGAWTFKALAGVTAKAAVKTTHDGAGTEKDWEVGGKAVLESWLNVSERLWLALDASFSTLDTNPGLRARVGYRVLPGLSLGLDASASALIEDAVAPSGDRHRYGLRAGPMVRYEWQGGEASLTAGLASSIDAADRATARTGASHYPFVSASVLMRY